MNGIELEKSIIDKFINAGWKVNVSPRYMLDNSRCISPDFEILDDNISYGFVEVYMNKNPERMLEKVHRGQLVIKELKPKLYILTDGVEYHISVCGKKFETIHFVPSPKSYYSMMAIIEDYADFMNIKEDDK